MSMPSHHLFVLQEIKTELIFFSHKTHAEPNFLKPATNIFLILLRHFAGSSLCRDLFNSFFPLMKNGNKKETSPDEDEDEDGASQRNA